MKKELTELEKELQQLAVCDWDRFCEVIGNVAIRKAQICMLRAKGKSHRQIMNKLKITRGQVRHGACNCAVK